jgi:hypothetical protein
MLQTRDFFQNEAKRCRASAESAARKADREFWLNMANRWDYLLHPNDEGDADLGAIRGLRPVRTIYNKRRRVA